LAHLGRSNPTPHAGPWLASGLTPPSRGQSAASRTLPLTSNVRHLLIHNTTCHIRQVKHFIYLALMCASSAVCATDFVELRVQTSNALIAGCTMAIVTPAVKSFMKRAADNGKPFSSESEAMAKLNAASQWTEVVLPGIERTCKCAMSKELGEIDTASSDEALVAITTAMQNRLRDPKHLELMEPTFRQCAQSNLPPLPKKQ
jgi:hypothetical protein